MKSLNKDSAMVGVPSGDTWVLDALKRARAPRGVRRAALEILELREVFGSNRASQLAGAPSRHTTRWALVHAFESVSEEVATPLADASLFLLTASRAFGEAAGAEVDHAAPLPSCALAVFRQWEYAWGLSQKDGKSWRNLVSRIEEDTPLDLAPIQAYLAGAHSLDETRIIRSLGLGTVLCMSPGLGGLSIRDARQQETILRKDEDSWDAWARDHAQCPVGHHQAAYYVQRNLKMRLLRQGSRRAAGRKSQCQALETLYGDARVALGHVALAFAVRRGTPLPGCLDGAHGDPHAITAEVHLPDALRWARLAAMDLGADPDSWKRAQRSGWELPDPDPIGSGYLFEALAANMDELWRVRYREA